VAPFVGAALVDLLDSYADAFLLLAGTPVIAAVLMPWSVPGPADR
jgi:hypothetical protein